MPKLSDGHVGPHLARGLVLAHLAQVDGCDNPVVPLDEVERPGLKHMGRIEHHPDAPSSTSSGRSTRFGAAERLHADAHLGLPLQFPEVAHGHAAGDSPVGPCARSPGGRRAYARQRPRQTGHVSSAQDMKPSSVIRPWGAWTEGQTMPVPFTKAASAPRLAPALRGTPRAYSGKASSMGVPASPWRSCS